MYKFAFSQLNRYQKGRSSGSTVPYGTHCQRCYICR